MADKKMTKKDWFMAIREQVETSDWDMADGALEFIDAQVEALDAKAKKAAERAADKKAEGDALRETVYGLLTEDWQTGDQIAAQVEDADVTKAKVVARLTQLIKAGMATKDYVKDGSRKVIAYKRA